MAALRRELVDDMRDVSESARAITDWTFYVRRFPWASAGLAALAGILIVPRKKEAAAPPDAATIAEALKQKQVWASAQQATTDANSIAKTVFWTIAAAAGRAALQYVSERIRTAAAEKHREPSEEAPASLR